MLTNLHIIQRAARITLDNKLLWLLGIFLSSGFNLHAWYGWQWLGESDWLAGMQSAIYSFGPVVMWFMVVAVFLFAVLVINFFKLTFLGYVHNSLHQVELGECVLCGQLKDQTVVAMLRKNKQLWLRTVVVSLLTILASVVVVGLFHFYTVHSQFNFLTAVIMLISLIVILIGISWWNLLTVLFMMWHGFPLPKAAGLSLDLLVGRLRRVGSITALATILFLVSIVAGASVLFQLPEFFASSPNYILTGSVFHTWQLTVSIISTGLFVFWLILNNVWFNVVMVILFDDLVKSDKILAIAPEPLFASGAASSSMHHSIDRMEKL